MDQLNTVTFPIDIDPETGEKLYLSPLVMMGSVIKDCDPIDDLDSLNTLYLAVEKTAGYEVRVLPLLMKLQLLWRIFLVLFFGPRKTAGTDPYLYVANQWYRAQQKVPLDAKLRIYTRSVREMFSFVPADKVSLLNDPAHPAKPN